MNTMIVVFYPATKIRAAKQLRTKKETMKKHKHRLRRQRWNN